MRGTLAPVKVEIREAALTDKAILRRLVELYMHDFSEFNGRDVDSHGLFGYRFLDHYWTEPTRHPYLISVDGRLAGFAFVRTDSFNQISEFFVLRKYRRQGVGQQAVRSLLARFPGSWRIEEVRENPQAREFWRAAIPHAFEEAATAEGWTQTFHIA